MFFDCGTTAGEDGNLQMLQASTCTNSLGNRCCTGVSGLLVSVQAHVLTVRTRRASFLLRMELDVAVEIRHAVERLVAKATWALVWPAPFVLERVLLERRRVCE